MLRQKLTQSWLFLTGFMGSFILGIILITLISEYGSMRIVFYIVLPLVALLFGLIAQALYDFVRGGHLRKKSVWLDIIIIGAIAVGVAFSINRFEFVREYSHELTGALMGLAIIYMIFRYGHLPKSER